MKHCPNCKRNYDDDAAFCESCGMHLKDGECAVAKSKGEPSKESPESAPNPYTSSFNTMTRNAPRPSYEHKEALTFLNFLYGLILYFILFPVMFPPYTFGSGFGAFGFGVRQQIASFNNLFSPNMNHFTMMLIQAVVILLVVAVILAVAMAITSLVAINRARTKSAPLNFRLLKVFNGIMFGSMAFIFVTTVPYLTYSFMVALLLSFFACLINLKPVFAVDFVKRKDNETRNSQAFMSFFIAMVFALSFSPIYDDWKKGSFRSYNFYDMVLNRANAAVFYQVVSIIIFLLLLALTKYLLSSYIFKLKQRNLIVNITVGVCIFLTVLIGAYARVENQTSDIAIELSANFYILLSSMIAVLIINLVQKVLSLKGKPEDKTLK